MTKNGAVWVAGNYYVWTKGTQAALSEHFNTAEFACQCTHAECLEQRISIELINKLEECRREFRAPIRITSGFRCGAHQRDLASDGKTQTVPKSTHERGDAVDVKGALMTVLVPILKKHFKAIGMARTWAHVDLRSDKVRRWFYA